MKQLVEERSKRMQTDSGDIEGKIQARERAIKEKEAFLEKCKGDYKRGELAASLYSEFYEETNREIDVMRGAPHTLTGMLTRPNDMDPFHIARMSDPPPSYCISLRYGESAGK